jgi:hypothetical protein
MLDDGYAGIERAQVVIVNVRLEESATRLSSSEKSPGADGRSWIHQSSTTCACSAAVAVNETVQVRELTPGSAGALSTSRYDSTCPNDAS